MTSDCSIVLEAPNPRGVTLIPVLPSSARPGLSSFFFWPAELESLTLMEEKQIPKIPAAAVFKILFSIGA